MADDEPKPSGTPTSRPRFGKVVGAATTSPTNLGVVGVAAVAAAATGLWPILALGGAAYAALVAWDTTNPSFWKKVIGAGSVAAAKLPDPRQVKDAAAREAVEGLVRARQEIALVLSETPPDVRAHLGAALTTVAELEGRAARLVARAEDLHRYLARTDVARAQAELTRLEGRARTASDVEAKKQFAEAHKAQQEQLTAIGDLVAAKERLDANLQRIVAAVAALPPKIVRMRAMDAQAMDDLSGNVNAELAAMNSDIRTFEETLKSLVEISLT